MKRSAVYNREQFQIKSGYLTVFNECYEIVCLSNKPPTRLCLLLFYWLLLRNKLGVIVTIQVSRLYRSDSIYVDYVVVLVVVVAREKKSFVSILYYIVATSYGTTTITKNIFSHLAKYNTRERKLHFIPSCSADSRLRVDESVVLQNRLLSFSLQGNIIIYLNLNCDRT